MIRSPASTHARRSSWTCLGATLLFTLLLLLPVSAQGQSPVQSLIEQGRKAGADAELLQSVASRAQAAGFGNEATADLLRPAVALAEQDLPAAPLLNKTLEGLAKRVPARRMSPVLRRLQTYTEEAGALVSTWSARSEVQSLLGTSGDGPPAAVRDQLIANIAEARQQDLPLQAVEQFLNELPSAVQNRPVSAANVATAVSVMPELPSVQDRPEVARQLLASALNAGYDSESLRQIPVALKQAQRSSRRPATALAQGTAQAIARGTPASSVLKSLFRGSLPGRGASAGMGNAPPPTPPGQGKPPTGAGPPNTPPTGDPPTGGRPDNPPGGGPPS